MSTSRRRSTRDRLRRCRVAGRESGSTTASCSRITTTRACRTSIDLACGGRDARHVKIAATPHNFADNARLLAALGSQRTDDHRHGSARAVLAHPRAVLRIGVSVRQRRRNAIRGAGAADAGAGAGDLRSESRGRCERTRSSPSSAIPPRTAARRPFTTPSFASAESPRRTRFSRRTTFSTSPSRSRAASVSRRTGCRSPRHSRKTRSRSPNRSARTFARMRAKRGAVNTLVRIGGRIVADNTDVDGFAALIAKTNARTAAVIGAGGTARAALVALRRAGIESTVFNRTAGQARTRCRSTNCRHGAAISSSIRCRGMCAVDAARMPVPSSKRRTAANRTRRSPGSISFARRRCGRASFFSRHVNESG